MRALGAMSALRAHAFVLEPPAFAKAMHQFEAMQVQEVSLERALGLDVQVERADPNEDWLAAFGA